jgi:hypothetical protein
VADTLACVLRRSTIVLCLLAASGSGATAMAKSHKIKVRTVALEVQGYVEGQYGNTVVDTAGQCGVTLHERASFDGDFEAAPIRLKLESGATAARATNAPKRIGTFAVTGTGYPANDCTAAPVAINCVGPIAGDPQGFHPTISLIVSHGTVLIDFSLATAALGEQDPGGVCAGSDPFAAGGPTGVLGVAPLLDPYLDVTAHTTLAALAKMTSRTVLSLRATPGKPMPGYNPLTCDGAADGAVISSCSGSVTGFHVGILVSRHHVLPPGFR